MVFTSTQYLFFLAFVVVVYYVIPHRYRWILLLAASYYFYISWNPKYLFLLIASTCVDYFVGRALFVFHAPYLRRFCLIIALVFNLSLLMFFKYWNFFFSSVNRLFSDLDITAHVPGHHFLLPLAISFYTFQSIGYIIDVYRRTIPAERHFGHYALYVSFFPQLIAGPIEHAAHMLPQYRKHIRWDESLVVRGLQWILWGFFLKAVIADNLALYVDSVYANVRLFEGLPLLIATYFFSFQIFCDFAGYSAIALGSANLLGINLIENFKRPYLSMSITEFWTRWHIALSRWFRDYVYISLGGNRVTFPRGLLNVFITFMLSGLWHGSNWTFIIWGCLHGIGIIVERLLRRFVPTSLKPSHFIQRFVRIFLTFHFVTFGWIFFRANSFQDAFYIISHFLSDWRIENILLNTEVSAPIFGFCILLLIFLVIESWFEERAGNISSFFRNLPTPFRWFGYLSLLNGILFFSANKPAEFIYFQF